VTPDRTPALDLVDLTVPGPDAAGTFAVRHVRAATECGIVDDATVVCEDGVIVAVDGRGAAPVGALDGRGLFCLPGLIDTHSDGLEKEIRPREAVTFPVDFALRSFEGRLRAAGVTTVFHGVGFEEKPAYHRTIEQAERVCRVIAQRLGSPDAPVDHRVLYRLEARTPVGYDAMLPFLTEPGPGEPPPLVSFEDHTPGQGQFRDIGQYIAALPPNKVPAGMTAEEFVAGRIAEADAFLEERQRNLDRLTAQTAVGAVTLLGHDCEDAADVVAAHGWGARVAEFPLSVEAARAAADLGMPVVMGAPNVLRGGSHSGNVAAEDLVAAGLCDVLASDYQPSTLLAAVFGLADRGAVPLHRAIGLVTSGPARMVGLDDRGRIEPGCRADLVLVAHDGHWPQVRAVWRSPVSTRTPSPVRS
jgi:alpha-D-ribose 1-methylphosphonate 5-triphosphate diphosphatase